MADEHRRRRRQQAKVLAKIAALPPCTTIEQWNKQRLTPDVIAPEINELRRTLNPRSSDDI